MSDQPMVTNRERLVAALCPADPPCSMCQTNTDALLASGVLATPAEYIRRLADNETVRESVEDALRELDITYGIPHGSGRHVLHALADALDVGNG